MKVNKTKIDSMISQALSVQKELEAIMSENENFFVGLSSFLREYMRSIINSESMTEEDFELAANLKVMSHLAFQCRNK